MEIASSIKKDPTTVSKEIQKYRTIKPYTWKAQIPSCINFKASQIQHLCKDITCLYTVEIVRNATAFVHGMKLAELLGAREFLKKASE